MPVIRAGFGDEVYGTARAVAILCRHVELQLLEFFHAILNRHVDRAAAQTLVGDAIDQETIEVFADTIDNSIVAVFEVHAGYVHRASAHLHQVKHVAAVQGQVVDLRGTHRGGQLRIFGVDGRGGAGDFHHFRSLTDLQFEVHVRDGAGVCLHASVG